MDNKLLMENYLLVLKSTVEVYVHGTLESSNEDVKETIHLGLNSTLEDQKETYSEMVKYGWYTISNVEQNIINQTINKVNSSN